MQQMQHTCEPQNAWFASTTSLLNFDAAAAERGSTRIGYLRKLLPHVRSSTGRSFARSDRLIADLTVTIVTFVLLTLKVQELREAFTGVWTWSTSLHI